MAEEPTEIKKAVELLIKLEKSLKSATAAVDSICDNVGKLEALKYCPIKAIDKLLELIAEIEKADPTK